MFQYDDDDNSDRGSVVSEEEIKFIDDDEFVEGGYNSDDDAGDDAEEETIKVGGADDIDEADDETIAEDNEEEQPEISGNITKERVIPDDERLTSDMLSRFEQTELITIRASQIEKYNNHLLTDDEIKGLHDPVEIAEKELQLRKIPLMLKREVAENILPDGTHEVYVEYWCPNTMIVLF